jgi:hypothetical protein
LPGLDKALKIPVATDNDESDLLFPNLQALAFVADAGCRISAAQRGNESRPNCAGNR